MTASGTWSAGALVAGRYQLVSILGTGGAGIVFKAHDRELDEVIALKVVNLIDSADQLRREVKLARRVTHRNVARTYELGTHDGIPFMTMELVEGRSLEQILTVETSLAIPRAMSILSDVCRGLEAAHAVGVVHGDIKPANILIATDHRVVVTDFGIARRFAEPAAGRAMMGTPAYMSPEQVEGRKLSDRSDVYSVGVLAFELLTGELPFREQGAFAIAEARLWREPPDPRTIRPDLSRELAQALLTAMKRDPDERLPSMTALRDVLSAELSAQPGWTPPVVTAAPPGAKPSITAIDDVDPGTEPDPLAVGFARELGSALSQVAALRVVSLHDGPGGRSAGRAGAAGEVDYAVRTRLVVLPGDEVEVQARLIRTADNHELASRTFAITMTRLLDAIDQIRRLVVGALDLTLATPARDVAPPPEAIDLYLRAIAIYRDHTRINEALDGFRKALALAPSSVLIQSAYALALLRKWIVVPQDNEGLLDRARSLIDRAIRNEPQLGEAHLARGYLALHTADPVTAVVAFRDAIARSPSLGLAHASLAVLLLEANRIEDGKARLHAARRLSPGFLELGIDVARSLALCGEWELASAELASHKALGLPSSKINWIRVLAYRGDRAAIEAERRELEEHGPEPLGIVTAGISLADVYLGVRPARSVYSRGDETVSEGVSSRRRSYVCQLGAELAGFEGNTGQAIRFIEIAERCGLFDLLWMERCPLLDSVRADPQFPGLLDRVARRAEAMADAMWTR